MRLYNIFIVLLSKITWEGFNDCIFVYGCDRIATWYPSNDIVSNIVSEIKKKSIFGMRLIFIIGDSFGIVESGEGTEGNWSLDADVELMAFKCNL